MHRKKLSKNLVSSKYYNFDSDIDMGKYSGDIIIFHS